MGEDSLSQDQSLLAVDQTDWDAVRLSLLSELSLLTVSDALTTSFHTMLVALTDAYDQPIPNYTVYRQLRTFQIARWPLLRNLLQGHKNAAVDEIALAKIIEQVTTMAQHAVEAADQYQADSLEVDMAVLSQLLDSGATPGY